MRLNYTETKGLVNTFSLIRWDKISKFLSLDLLVQKLPLIIIKRRDDFVYHQRECINLSSILNTACLKLPIQ